MYIYICIYICIYIYVICTYIYIYVYIYISYNPISPSEILISCIPIPHSGPLMIQYLLQVSPSVIIKPDTTPLPIMKFNFMLDSHGFSPCLP